MRKSESERLRESVRVSFEHRDENKSLGVIKPAWNHPKTSQAKPSQAGLAWLVLQKRGSWLGLAWLVNSRRGHWLGFDLAFRQATHHDYI